MKFTWYKPAKLVAEPSPCTAAARYAGGELLVQTGGLAEFVAAYGTDPDLRLPPVPIGRQKPEVCMQTKSCIDIARYR
jgi:hypothetical protein